MTPVSHIRRTAFLGCALAAAGLALPAPVLAEQIERTEYVSFGDLDLTSEEGVETLDRRLNRAVTRVCGTEAFQVLAVWAQVRDCKRGAREGIAPQRDAAIARARGLTPTVEIAGNTGGEQIALIVRR
jgi:UrcA family protein